MRTRDESGATAVIVGILAVVLFGVAALAVDLGNAWARERSVQKQVDVTALSVGHLLPASASDLPAIADAAAAYLTGNVASGQEAIVVDDLKNGVLADGEVRLQDEDGDACTSECVRLEITAPGARVDFGLAGVLGESGLDVQRSAVVQAFSAIPRGESVLPFWLPSGCALGPAMLDVAPGNSGKFAASPAPATTSGTTTSATTTTSTQTVPVVLPSDVQQGTHAIVGPAAPSVAGVGQTLSVGNLRLTGIPSNIDRASIRFVAPDGSWHEYAAMDVGKTDPLIVPSFSIGPEVTGTPGAWRVFGVVQEKNDKKLPQISTSSLEFTVNGPAPVVPPPPVEPAPEPASDAGMVEEIVVAPTTAVGCVGQQRGNFGQLDSPRKGGSGTADTLALNIAAGLDHLLAPYPFPAGTAEAKDCGSGAGLLPDAQLDSSSRDGNNCIAGLPGNRVSPLAPGFITGVAGHPGRIAATRGTTTCPGRSNVSYGGATVNNDVLSCFLRTGYSLEHISRPSGVTPTMLDPAVIHSPRFVWVPVVGASDRVQKGFQPIREFAPAFITDEGPTSTRTTTDATAANGIVLNGGGKQVQGVQVYVFNKDALPIEESAPTVAYDPVVGMKVARLVR
ncbi:hypothetical protein G6553_05920 [Nocardioides sp. IC4_145]|uniref:TadE/TadG family type IV pilus assembly protein n=1 Tax=Nocardioides sp. IC4_145 TaxID=2714037 RepID=UPI00140B6C1C|nr:hypothetical protein [Nocardioides sp. IC4_145]NHC22712.1 hypothetical protein [Nocardioides sp. IC4_145]